MAELDSGRRRRQWLTRAAALAAAGGLTGCHGVFSPQGPIADADWTILLDSLAIMLAIGIPTIGMAIGFAWWFRESNPRAVYRPDFAYSGRVELIVWSIPILVIMFLGGLIWIGSHELDPWHPIPGKSKPLDVQVVSLDWAWLFIYPEQGVAAVNELVLPAGRPVHFYLTSASVMNTFFVPELGSMIYTMYGMTSQLYLEAYKPGVFYGRSAQFSGDGFSDMQFAVHAVEPAGFDAWIKKTQAAGPVLNTDQLLALYQQSFKLKPFTYRAVTPGLFTALANKAIPPSPGPVLGRPARGVSPRSRF